MPSLTQVREYKEMSKIQHDFSTNIWLVIDFWFLMDGEEIGRESNRSINLNPTICT